MSLFSEPYTMHGAMLTSRVIKFVKCILLFQFLTDDWKSLYHRLSYSFTGDGYTMPDFTMESSAGIVGWTEWSISDRSCPLKNLNNITALNHPSYLWQSVQALLFDLQ